MDSMVFTDTFEEEQLLEEEFMAAMLQSTAASSLMTAETAHQMMGGVLSQMFSGVDEAEQVVIEIENNGYRYIISRCKIETNRIHLSPREQEIVRLIAQGLPNKTIASVLDISQHTVATYIKRLFIKLDVCSRAQMIARVLDSRG